MNNSSSFPFLLMPPDVPLPLDLGRVRIHSNSLTSSGMITLLVKKFFPMSSPNLSMGYEAFPLILSLDPKEESSAPPFALLLRRAPNPKTFLTGRDFQPFHQLCCLALNTFKDIHIFPKLWGPELHAVLK